MEGALDLSAKVTPERSTDIHHEAAVKNAENTTSDSPPVSSASDPYVAPTSRTTPSSLSPAPPPMRPFKMYPMDSLNSLYSNLATQTSFLGGPGLYPYGSLPGTVPLLGIADPGLLLGTTPISQYMQNRKRRFDSRSSSVDSIDPVTATSEPSSPVHESRSLGHNSSPIKRQSPGPVIPNSPYQRGNGREAIDSIKDSHHSEHHAFMHENAYLDDSQRFQKPPHASDVPRETSESGSCAPSTPSSANEINYWDRRRKNNEAAKRSRDARRMKEEEIALRAAFLEQENLKLRAQVSVLKSETAKLHYMLYNR